MPAGYLQAGYFGQDGHPRAELILDWAREMAERLSGPGRMRQAQIRRFFGHARLVEGRLRHQEFGAVRSDILKMAPAARDAVQRGVAPPLFQRFIDANVQLAGRDENHYLKGFLPHFEAIMGFFPRR